MTVSMTRPCFRCRRPWMTRRRRAAARSPAMSRRLGDAFQRLANRLEDAIDLRRLDDERRGEGERGPGPPPQRAGLQDLEERFVRARPRLAGARLELDRAHQADVADIDDVALAFQRVDPLLELLPT